MGLAQPHGVQAHIFSHLHQAKPFLEGLKLGRPFAGAEHGKDPEVHRCLSLSYPTYPDNNSYLFSPCSLRALGKAPHPNPLPVGEGKEGSSQTQARQVSTDPAKLAGQLTVRVIKLVRTSGAPVRLGPARAIPASQPILPECSSRGPARQRAFA